MVQRSAFVGSAVVGSKLMLPAGESAAVHVTYVVVGEVEKQRPKMAVRARFGKAERGERRSRSVCSDIYCG